MKNEHQCIDEYLTAQLKYQEKFLQASSISKSFTNSIEPKCQNNTKLVIVTHSSPNDFIKRETIRLTWGHWTLSSRFYNIDNQNPFSKRIELFFIVGRNDKFLHSDLVTLSRESDAFHDIIYYPNLYDTYYNLTHKTIAMLNWTIKSCSSAEFLLKTDTDIFLNIPLLANSINRQNLMGQSFVAGRTLKIPSVNRNRKNKWYVSKEEYKNDFFPTHVEGPAYIISKLAIQMLNEKLQVINDVQKTFRKFEDVFLGILIQNSRISLLDWKQFLIHDNNPNFCLVNEYIAVHKVSYFYLISSWCSLISMYSTCPNLVPEQINLLVDASSLSQFDLAYN